MLFHIFEVTQRGLLEFALGVVEFFLPGNNTSVRGTIADPAGKFAAELPDELPQSDALGFITGLQLIQGTMLRGRDVELLVHPVMQGWGIARAGDFFRILGRWGDPMSHGPRREGSDRARLEQNQRRRFRIGCGTCQPPQTDAQSVSRPSKPASTRTRTPGWLPGITNLIPGSLARMASANPGITESMVGLSGAALSSLSSSRIFMMGRGNPQKAEDAWIKR